MIRKDNVKRRYVRWLKPGERGWEDENGNRWKWDGKKMFVRWRDRKYWDDSISLPDDFLLCEHEPRFPFPVFRNGD